VGFSDSRVRIFTNKSWNGGLFVLDALKFPYGCAVWPAWWMVGPDWPNGGEVDIFEGVNIRTVNQYCTRSIRLQDVASPLHRRRTFPSLLRQPNVVQLRVAQPQITVAAIIPTVGMAVTAQVSMQTGALYWQWNGSRKELGYGTSPAEKFLPTSQAAIRVLSSGRKPS